MHSHKKLSQPASEWSDATRVVTGRQRRVERVSKHRGFALLTAIWIMVVLLILVGGFAALTHGEMAVARNFGDLTRAAWAARAGVRLAEVAVADAAKQAPTDLGGTALTIDSTEEEVNLGDATYQVVVSDEAGKLNLNTATREQLEAFFDPAVAAAIIDWRDTDSAVTGEGAEDDYYMGLTPPYHCKNGDFATVDELLQVKGVTPEDLDAEVTEDGFTLRDLLTVTSRDSNTDAQGQARVNIRTATQAVLTQQFGSVLTAQEITALIQARTTQAFQSPADLLRAGVSRQKLAQIYDRLTTSTESVRPGLVNLNTAPVEVLATVPGLDDAAARAIDTYRTNSGALDTVGDLLNIEGISDAAFREAADRLTTRSQRFRVVAQGYWQERLTKTITCIVQSDGMVTRTLYWQE